MAPSPRAQQNLVHASDRRSVLVHFRPLGSARFHRPGGV